MSGQCEHGGIKTECFLVLRPGGRTRDHSSVDVRLFCMIKTENSVDSVFENFQEGFHLEEKRKSLDELLKYRIKMENENSREGIETRQMHCCSPQFSEDLCGLPGNPDSGWDSEAGKPLAQEVVFCFCFFFWLFL